MHKQVIIYEHLFTSANSFVKVSAITWESVVLKYITVLLAYIKI